MNKILAALCLSCPSLLVSHPCSAQAPLQVGYTNCVQVATYSESLIQQIGQLRWFFAHASVGNNMMDGIDALHGRDPARFPYARLWDEDGVPPDQTRNAGIYGYWRGNPGWPEKVDSFAAYASNGWCYPKANVAANKFCFVDQDADLGYYLNSMSNLERTFPETAFVYMTIPLMTTTDEDNLKRNVYNDALRQWTAANNRILFDVADIQSHDPNGVPCLFTNHDRVGQRLADAYVSPGDDGHLNPQGKELVALGFYAVAAALFAVDRDHDGLSDGQELIAGTRPLDGMSSLKLAAELSENGSIGLNWPGATNRVYTVQRRSELTDGSFTTVLGEAPATPPLNTFKDSPPGSGPFFYRVLVRQ